MNEPVWYEPYGPLYQWWRETRSQRNQHSLPIIDVASHRYSQLNLISLVHLITECVDLQDKQVSYNTGQSS